MDRFILQTVLMPSEQTCMTEELFFHRVRESICFDGYFNVLSCAKWNRYTKIKKLCLVVEGEGRFETILYSERGELGRTSSQEDGTFVLELPASDMQDFLWFAFRPCSKDARLLSAAYMTEQAPLRPIRLAADICTFRREAYVRRNLEILRTELLENESSPLYQKMDIFLVDNGCTLQKEEVEQEHVRLFPNKNAGGSGGFTRGILEILKRKKKNGYTHIIFLDDDAVLLPDTFIRCFALLSFLKEEFTGSCIAGALLDEEVPYMQQEAGAYYRGGVPVAARTGVDLRDRATVFDNEKLENVDYAGWWCACFPLSFVRPDNLPLPFFLHFDDMEYGLRNAREIIYLNGICVWHAAPQKRRPQTNIFYHIRNRMVTDAIRGTDHSLKKILLYCLNEITYNTLRYQYGAADMVLQAVKDFAGGPKRFGAIDPEARNNQIRSLADPYLKPDELTDNDAVQEQIRNYCVKTVDTEWRRPLISKKKYILTLNGWLLPARKENPEQVVCCDIFQPDMRELYRAERALLIDPYAGKGAWVEKNWFGALHSLFCMVQVCWILLTRYRQSAAQFRQKRQYLMSSRFWMDYLDLRTRV